MTTPFDGYNVYYGDLHSHCNIGYAHGSIEDAFHNARLQLDFACVTVHAHWHDIPEQDERLADVVAYHRRGFERTAANWSHLQDVVRANHRDGQFVAFLGFEWHSLHYGDHNIYFNGAEGDIIRAGDMDELRAGLYQYQERGIETMLIPHHIGYKAGYRGINWDEVNPEFIRVVEIMSMHGASESDEAPYPYLHTMGPRDWRSSLHYGLEQGHIVGVVGSTDHHSAHPGSYGRGRAGVWATELTRAGIWEAIQARRTYALTGDRIALQFSLNGQPMGAVVEPCEERALAVAVEGGGALDMVELLHNNRVIRRWDLYEREETDVFAQPVKVYLEVGWGEQGQNVDWQVELEIVAGELLAVEPRFRGHEIVAPQSDEQQKYAFSRWRRKGAAGLEFSTRTWGNVTATTPSTQGVCLQLRATPDTLIRGSINGKEVGVKVAELVRGPQSDYLGGFLTPAFYFHRAIPCSEYAAGGLRFTHHVSSQTRDWYYVRVRQKNGQWAWSSPIWVGAGHDPARG
jgi:hypothetical protein